MLSDLLSNGATSQELTGAKNRARRQLVQRLDSVGSRADLIAHATVYRNDPGYVNTVFDAYARVELADLAAQAERVLAPDSGTTLHVVPGSKP